MLSAAAKPRFMRIHKFLSSLVLISLACGVMAQEEPKMIDKVVAVIGENMVLHSDIEQQVDQMTMNDIPVTSNTRCQILEDQMYQKLFVSRARLDSVTVTEEQIEQELNTRLRYFISQIGSEEELVKFYGKTIDQIKEDFKDEVEEILLIQQMQQTVIGGVKVSPAEVREFYASIPKDSLPYINSQARVAQIVRRPPVSQAQEDAIKAQLRGYIDRVKSGSIDFATLAILYSDDEGSAQNGGELGLMSSSDLVPEFANAALGLQKDEISDVIKTQFGYHIIQMIERKGDRFNVRHILKIPQVSPENLDVARQFLDSLATEIRASDTLTFAKAAIKFSSDENTRMNGGEMINPTDGTNLFDVEMLGQIDQNLMFTLQKMKVGEIAGPELFIDAERKRAFRLVSLVDMTDPHVANLKDDYHRIADTAKRKKENEKLEAWINKHCNSAYVWVDPRFEGCPFQTKWEIAQR